MKHALIAFALLFCGTSAQATELSSSKFSFRFAPPDGTAFVRAYRLVRERIVDGRTQFTDEARGRARGVFN